MRKNTHDSIWLEAVAKFCSVEQLSKIMTYVLQKRKDAKDAPKPSNTASTGNAR